MLTPIAGLKISAIGPYSLDTGCDIHVPQGTPVRAMKAGHIVYSEPGHTEWKPSVHPECPFDTANSILLEFHEPFYHAGKAWKYAWYTHLSKLAFRVADGDTGLDVRAGEYLGKTGVGNNDPHLHLGILLHRAQEEGDYMPPDMVAHVLRALIKGVKP